MPHVVTWGYATLSWTHLVTKSGIPRQTLSQALMSFDLSGCYLNTLIFEMEPDFRDTVRRVALPSRHASVISKLTEIL